MLELPGGLFFSDNGRIGVCGLLSGKLLLHYGHKRMHFMLYGHISAEFWGDGLPELHGGKLLPFGWIGGRHRLPCGPVLSRFRSGVHHVLERDF